MIKWMLKDCKTAHILNFDIPWKIYKHWFGFQTKLIMRLLYINGPHDSKGG